jgi:cellulose synthase/poly-beta-1,6-N-acetylglucosamine synthase-like glycosyltransferase
VFYFFALVLLWLSWKSFRGGIAYLKFFTQEIAKPLSDFTPFCTIIAPCRGVDHDLRENFSALFRQDFPSYEIIFVTEDECDPANQIIKDVQCEFASQEKSNATSQIIFSGFSNDTAQKVHKLRCAVSHASPKSEIFVFVDSDSRPKENWLSALIAPLAEKKIGCATGYRWFISERGGFASQMRAVWNASIASALGANMNSNFCWGGSLAIPREIFEKLNINERWRGTLSDDFTVTRAMREASLPIAFVPQALNASLGECGTSELFEFTTRQMKITRVYAPNLWKASFIGSFFFCGVFWSGVVLLFFLKFASLDFFVTLGLLAMIFALGFGKAFLRLKAVGLVLTDYENALRRSFVSHVFLWALTPFIFFYNSFCALLSRKVVWRGIEYELRSPTETVVIGRSVDSRDATSQSEFGS